MGRSNRHEMITYVNLRPVESRALNGALIDGYQASLPKGRYPVAFLFIRCDPAAVDVNVHPAKREVRFRHEAAVRGFVVRSILQRLREFGAAAAPNDARVYAEGPAATALRLAESALPAAPAPFRGFAESSVPPGGRAAADSRPRSAPDPGSDRSEPVPAAAVPPEAAGTGRWRWLGLAHGAYAVFETTAGLVLLDWRAAHERIWFERLQAQFGPGEAPSQRLLLPIPLELDPVSSALLLDRSDFLARHGFEVGAFGRNFFRLEAVPTWMEPADAELFLRDLLAAFREGRREGENLDLAREVLVRLAAARAVRTSARAEAADMPQLVADLFATPSPLTSPAGRPTFVEINLGELGRRFHKT